jgi:hypothetical protein
MHPSTEKAKMAYEIRCKKHGVSKCDDILDLIENRTNKKFGRNGGEIICPKCKGPAAIFRSYKLQEKGRTWQCQIKQIVRIPSEIPTYVPYVLFTSGQEAGNVSDGIMVSYYKDTRGEGGKLKHGHGPGGPAVLGKDEVLQLIRHLIHGKLITAEDIKNILKQADDTTN